MSRVITMMAVASLQAVHGAGRVAVLTAGADDFAFKVPDGKKAQEILEREEDGAKDALELAMRQALLCPAAPNAGRGIAADRELSKADADAMAAERAALEGLITKVPILGDQLGRALAAHAGYRAVITTDKHGDTYSFSIQLSDGLGGLLDEPPILVTAKRPSRAAYGFWREKRADAWDAADYLLKHVCTSNNAEELIARAPFAAFTLGSQLLPGLGYEEVKVSVKKFSASDSQTP